MTQFETSKLVIEAYTGNLDQTFPIGFSISENTEFICMTIGDVNYNIHKDHFIRLGQLSKPITYKEPSVNNCFANVVKYY